ncbi:Hypothetical predicted protein [Olea europaea subsp. europaea]|uniref:Uncharacterized protein n=1 Tax=Olea europaea subsp. europaea TaxID=158383 RepID=A0A8S0T2U7_OLEEU|nr:Hypothetical predicted protein [Olea europaea subsp. europaea]
MDKHHPKQSSVDVLDSRFFAVDSSKREAVFDGEEISAGRTLVHRKPGVGWKGNEGRGTNGNDDEGGGGEKVTPGINCSRLKDGDKVQNFASTIEITNQSPVDEDFDENTVELTKASVECVAENQTFGDKKLIFIQTFAIK